MVSGGSQMWFRSSGSAIILLMVVFGILPLFSFPTFYYSFLTAIFLTVTLAESWNVIGGYAGYLSLGNVAFFGIGAYTVAILVNNYSMSPLLTSVLGGIFSLGVAAAIGYPTLKLKGPYFALATLAVALLLREIFVEASSITNGGIGINNIQLPSFEGEQKFLVLYVAFFLLMVLTIWVSRKIEQSKFGFGLIAIREDEDAARSLAISTTRLKLEAFMISAFFTGMAGAFFAPYVSYINPDSAFNVIYTILPVLTCLFGGRGKWQGPLIGGLILGFISQYLSFVILSTLNIVVYGAVLVAVMILLPQGIAGSRTKR